jgi:23S rRNA (cytosine1962-C5)-methyltransferase
MGHDCSAFLGGELRRIVKDVGERLVELAYVVEQRHALDAAEGSLVEPGCIAEDERIGRDATHMGAGNRIVRVDCVEKRFERGGAESLGSRARGVLAIEQPARGGRADCHRYEFSHGRALRKNRTERADQGAVTRTHRRAVRGHRPAQDTRTDRPRDNLERKRAAITLDGMTVARVSAKGARRWLGGHPWIYRTDVTERPMVDAGAVLVHDQRGKPLGWALWSPLSEISLRLLDKNPDAVIDQAWWDERIASAIARRVPLEDHTNAFRLVHGEADGCPSLVCDRYGEWLVVQFMSAGLEHFREEIVGSLRSLAEPAGILARNDVSLRTKEGLPRETVVLDGDVPREIEVHEYGLRFLAAPWTGQKTGAFLDQRENRHFIGTVARGRALDCFSYHGSFALHLAKKATHVTALDASGPALMRAAENAARNSIDNISFVEANAFDYLREKEREGITFDTIVLDPPAFAKTRAALPAAMRGYKDINLRAMRLLAPGGLLYTASCSFHLTKPLFLEMLQNAASDSGRRVAIRALTGQPLDHPEVLSIPETGYIKGALLEVMD